MIAQRKWAFERGILYALDWPGETRTIAPRASAIFKEIGSESADPLAAAMGIADCRTVVMRFSNRRRCFSAWVENRIAAYGWVSQTAECIGEQERVIQLQPREAYIWDCATLPEYRGRGLYSALLNHIVAALHDEGVRRVWIGSSLENHPSLRGFGNAGFQPILTMVFARLFNVCCLSTIGHPQAPSPLVAAARRALLTDQERGWGPILIERTRPAVSPPCAEAEF